MSLREHAERELTLAGEDREVIDWYLTVIDAFTSAGHSGGSAMVAIPVLNQLLQFRNLSDLTDDPDEWNFISGKETGGSDIWQSQRRADAFSNDGGKSYYLLGEAEGNTKIYPSVHKDRPTEQKDI